MKLADRAREGQELRGRIAWIGFAFAIGFLILAGRLWHLQIRKGEEYFAKSEGNFIKELRVPADRGMILDRKGEILVDNRPSYDVHLTPAFCQDCDEVIGTLAGLLSLEAEDLQRVTEGVAKARGLSSFQPLLVRLDLTRDELDVLEAWRDRLPGVDILPAPHRNYRNGHLTAHVLGYLSEIGPEELEKSKAEGRAYRPGDYVGRRGVEKRYETYLRGRDGVERVVADAKGRKLPHLQGLIPEGERYVASEPGDNVVLSIDARLQRAAEEAFDGEAGAAVVVDVHTGYVLAAVSKPAYDPNVMTGRISREELKKITDDPLEPMLFRLTQNHFHPGSVWKVVTQLAALKEGFDGHVFCGGGYTFGRRRWRCHKASGHGHVGPEKAMQTSCDTWFYAAADRIGIEPLADMARHFGFGSVTGLDLGFEVPGVVPDVAYHDRFPGGYQRGFALNAVIGQGDVNSTPLQVAMAYAAIANGGTVYKPRVVRRIVRPDGTLVQDFLPEAKDKLGIAPEAMKVVREGLEMVVQAPGGTAYSKRLANIRVAGKTGTAQVVRIGSVRLKKEQMDFFSRDHAWFAAYAPVEDPQIAVVVLNEHGGHGGSDAAPIAMRIIERYFELLEADRGPTSTEPPAETPAPVRLESPGLGPALPQGHESVGARAG